MVVNSRKRYSKVLVTALAAALLLMMILSLNVAPVFSSDGYTCLLYDDYGQCIAWDDTHREGK